MAQTREGWVEVAGVPIHYRVGGHGPVLLLLPDAGDGAACAALAAEMGGYTVVTCDRRPDATVDTHADDVARVLVAVTTHEAHVVGAGRGAVIGLDLVARHPHRAATLVAYEPADTDYDVDVAAVRASHARVVPAAGRDSRGQPGHDVATELATRLATPLVEFDGDHDAPFTQPRAFAAQLHRILDTPGLVATP
jgi:pimeloyl-ACP methyl ester carboxylesterase